MENQNRESFDEVKTRLDQIVETVSDEDISLDDALGLYEEAVKLGMQAASLLEEDIDQEQVDEAVAVLEEAEALSVEQVDEVSSESQAENEAENNE